MTALFTNDKFLFCSPLSNNGIKSSSPLLLHRLFLFPTLILWDFASVLESPDIPASGAVILSKGPQGHHIVIVGEDSWDAVRGTLLVFPETFPQRLLREAVPKFQILRRKLSAHTSLLAWECPTEASRAFVGSCWACCGDLSLCLCSSVLFYFGCEPSLQPSLACL